MLSFKVIYIAASLMVGALARPGPPTGTYYAIINPQGTVCVQANWVPHPHEDVELGVKCGTHFKDSDDLTVDEGPPFTYKIDSDSADDFRRFRIGVDILCRGFVHTLPGDLYKFDYHRGSNTIVTTFHAQRVELKPGHC
ncbi:hypothetical protein FOZ60_011524 [Perkinsus olseni]|uniref:Uncharacterized protein n=1 Tax=Perkinsus olseni TaxID=32597 RepID=A0A7J6PR71_PEROL|nr:hypothetical protein FOZ60_011524 [Perkinsus olseni]KAF4698071.1 hypothetical protein FOZ62_019023 [Perkinsus olseni]